MEQKKRTSFKGSIGFVLAAAGSAVGLGNIWRFPYLAAKDGGGMFLVIYLVLALTFGFTLLITEVAIGRKTKQSPLTAYGVLHKKWKGLGVIACLVPAIILPYYCVIGGWVVKYLLVYLTGHGDEAASPDYFTSFISDKTEPLILMGVFILIVMAIILMGVNKGIESTSKVIMPVLVLLVIAISVFSLTISHVDGDEVRTGVQGFKTYVVPSFKGMSVSRFFSVLMDATGQLFFSLSVAMGIMVAYGSYVHDDANIRTSVIQIEIFDTVIAFLAGAMIIPAVYVFEGTKGLEASGPSLMFATLPRVFSEMGKIGGVIGLLFFAMVLFAALTSAISIMEAVVSSFMDEFHISRKKATVVETVIALAAAIIVCMGYNLLYIEVDLPTGAQNQQILDIMDYASNNVLMPLIAIGTCVLIGWVLGPKTVIDEVEKNGTKMGRKKLYVIMIKYVAPVMLVVLFLKSIGVFEIVKHILR